MSSEIKTAIRFVSIEDLVRTPPPHDLRFSEIIGFTTGRGLFLVSLHAYHERDEISSIARHDKHEQLANNTPKAIASKCVAEIARQQADQGRCPEEQRMRYLNAESDQASADVYRIRIADSFPRDFTKIGYAVVSAATRITLSRKRLRAAGGGVAHAEKAGGKTRDGRRVRGRP